MADAGTFKIVDNAVASYNARAEAAKEFDVNPEDICVCFRCASLRPFDEMEKYGHSLVCSDCFEDL